MNIYTKKFKERINIKIDLLDAKGVKVNINTKGDGYANEYLLEKTVYELNSFNIPQKTEEDTNLARKKNNRETKKKKKKETKEKVNKDNEKESKEIELVLEPVKIDGYCFRTIKEDQSLEDNEIAGGKDKKGAKKK